MKKHYIVVTVEKSGKFYSYVLPVSENVNLIAALKINGIINATTCGTRERAADIVNAWNDSYKRNGSFLFDTATI